MWSELLKPAPERRVVDWLSANGPEAVLSAIVLGELRFFAAKQPEGRKKRYAEQILVAIEAAVGSRFVDFGERDAVAYGDLMARMRHAGTPLPVLDGLIAAQAIAREFSVATRNTKDFHRTGVALIDPWMARVPPGSN